jgi:iron complex transport system substrate-binding protein
MRLSAAGDTNSKSSSRNVFVLKDFNTLKDIATNIRTLGQLTFATQEAETLAKEYENTLEKIRARGKKMGPKIKIVGFYPDGAVSGRGTLFDDIVTAAGGENLISTLGLSGWPKLSDEVAATLNPDLLVCGGQSSEKEKIVAAIQQKPGWRAIPAVKAGRLLVLPGNQLGATSQHVLKAVTALQKELLHVQAAAAKDKI